MNPLSKNYPKFNHPWHYRRLVERTTSEVPLSAPSRPIRTHFELHTDNIPSDKALMGTAFTERGFYLTYAVLPT